MGGNEEVLLCSVCALRIIQRGLFSFSQIINTLLFHQAKGGSVSKSAISF